MVIFYRRLITNPRKGRYVSSVHNLVNDFWCGCLMLNKASMHKMFVDVQYYFYSCHHYPSNKARAVRAGEAGVPHKDLSPEVSGKPRGQGGAWLSMFLFCNCAVQLPLRRQGKFSLFFPFFSFRIAMLFWMCVHGLTSLPLVLQGTKYYIYICLKKREKRKPCINYKNKLLRYPRWVKHPVLSTSCFVSF